MSILSNLNEQQARAASITEGPLKIIAGAGSGKTRTISYRAAYMIQNGIKPKNILMLTFTNKAAKEIIHRAKGITHKSSRITKGTFHSVCLRILKHEIEHLPDLPSNFAIYDGSDQLSVVKDCIRTFKFGAGKPCAKTILSMISGYKNSGMNNEISDYFSDESDPYHGYVWDIYPMYQEKLAFYAAMDFDDILIKTIELLEDNEEVRKKYDDHFKYVMVDEYQDTNGAQVKFLKLLNQDNNNICVVGDDDQSIYKFRGAVIENILEFEKDFPGCQVVKLEDNYRSNDKILDLSNAVIEENTKRSDKRLRTDNKTEKRPRLYTYDESEHESQSICEEIQLKVQNNEIIPKEIAVIFRSSVSIMKFEEQLSLMGIPYRVYGGQRLRDRSEIKDVLGYLQLVNNPRDEVALRRVINTPNRGIGKKTLDDLISRSKETGKTLLDTIYDYPHIGKAGALLGFTETLEKIKTVSKGSKDIGRLVETIVSNTNYLTHIEKTQDSPKKVERKKNSLRFFSDMAQRYSDANGDFASLKKFIENFTLTIEEEEEEENCVSLMTVHASKGLEFERVYIPFCNENLFPHKRAVIDGDIEEERRLMYVALTRAKEDLIVSYSKEQMIYGKMTQVHPSRFIYKKDNLFEVVDKTSFGNLKDSDWGEMLASLGNEDF